MANTALKKYHMNRTNPNCLCGRDVSCCAQKGFNREIRGVGKAGEHSGIGGRAAWANPHRLGELALGFLGRRLPASGNDVCVAGDGGPAGTLGLGGLGDPPCPNGELLLLLLVPLRLRRAAAGGSTMGGNRGDSAPLLPRLAQGRAREVYGRAERRHVSNCARALVRATRSVERCVYQQRSTTNLFAAKSHMICRRGKARTFLLQRSVESRSVWEAKNARRGECSGAGPTW